MSVSSKINLAIVGAVGRGGSFVRSVQAIDGLRLHAVCDLNQAGLDKAAAELGVTEKYTDYVQMLEKADIDAVLIGTPMPLHVTQAIEAVSRGIHVISEVPAGVSVEGEYIHELKGLNEITKWRRKWQTGINGITYGTHSLGPILQWFPGERVVSVCSAGSGHHFTDPRGEIYENEDSCVMLCRMSRGGLVKIRVDMLSDRPHSMTNYQLQGTNGCYESARSHGMGEKNKVWLKSRDKDGHKWQDIEELAGEFTPEVWIRLREAAEKAGHGGGDLLELIEFVDGITGKARVPIGIHEAMDMTLPGLVSQASIAAGGQWIAVPDSRAW